MRFGVFLLCVSLCAQDLIFRGSLRTRVESWDWFQASANSDYTFPGSILRFGLSQNKRAFDWQIEFAAPFLLGLPDNAIAPGAQGQLGFGATYFAANNRNTNATLLFLKQGSIRWKGGMHSLRLGRMEFVDGTEIAPKDETLSALKRDRVAHRLLGNFVFSDVGRSFDGLQYTMNKSKLNFTLVGGRPTRGVFQVDGWGELNAGIFYGALTSELPGRNGNGEWRVFALAYNDYRDRVLKTDNRPLAARQADTGHIGIATVGGHFLQTVQTGAGTFDGLFWSAVQGGTWGKLRHRAGAFAAEAGWQVPVAHKIKPWLRAGYNRASGDNDSNDATHGTFFQVLPTPRVYARFPFFNMMNLRDAFGEVVLRPAKSIALRSDLHSLRLADSNDLWYSGGGIFQPWTFGYTGRPSNGQFGLATLYDTSADYNINPHLSIGAYYAYARGKLVLRSVYPKGPNANFGFLEFAYRF